jgi:hypothetical protein
MPSQQALDDMNLRRRLPISLICPRSINRRGRAAILQTPVLLLAPSGS